MMSALGLPLLLGVLGQAPPQEGKMPESPADRLNYMKKSLSGYTVHPRRDEGLTHHLQDDPVLRWTNPVGGSKDGCVFLWVGEEGRPSAAAGVYWNPQKVFLQEFSSLSTTPMMATSPEAGDWSPSRPGVEFKPIPDAPKPADTPERRLRQMNALAEGFSARHFYMWKTWNQLRLLTKPFIRYGKPGTPIEDGALFCFAYGTDPEVLLMIEARPGKQGAEWQYAFAPMTTFEVNASWKDKEVWNKPSLNGGEQRDPSNTFLVRRYSAPPE
jgi:hypothetical protein